MISIRSLLLSSYSRCIPKPATIVQKNKIIRPPQGRENLLTHLTTSTNNPTVFILPMYTKTCHYSAKKQDNKTTPR